MFRKKYKEFIDQTEPNRELIDKIFKTAEEDPQKSSTAKVYKLAVKYGAAVAAVLVLSVSAVLYTQLNNADKDLILPDTDNHHTEEVVLNSKTNASNNEASAETKQAQPGEKTAATSKKDIPAPAQEEYAYTEQRVADVTDDMSEVKDNTTLLSALQEVSDNESQLIYTVLKDALGEKDPETGNEYSFELVGKFQYENEQYYLGRWRWLVEDHSSLLCEFVLKGSLSEMYECRIENDSIMWKNENNLLRK